MLKGYNRNHLYSYQFIEKLLQKECVEIIEVAEGCLIDNFLLYDYENKKYYICFEYALNEWSSCYKVITYQENILNIWEKFYKEWEEASYE